MDTLYLALEISCYVIAGAVVVLNATAPLTKTERDDKIGRALSWVNAKLQAFVLPALRAKRDDK